MTINGSLLGTALLPPAWAAAKYWKTPSGHTATDLSVNNDMSVWGVVTTGGGFDVVRNNYIWRDGTWYTLPTRGHHVDVSLDGDAATVHVSEFYSDAKGDSFGLYRFAWDGTKYAQVYHVPAVGLVDQTMLRWKPAWRGSLDGKRSVRLDGANFGVYEWDGSAMNLLATVNPADGVATNPNVRVECCLSGNGKVLVAAIMLSRELNNWSLYLKRWDIADDGTVNFRGALYFTGNPALSVQGDPWFLGGMRSSFDGSMVVGGMPSAANDLGKVARFVWDGSKYVSRHDRQPPQGSDTTGMGSCVALTRDGKTCFTGAPQAGRGVVYLLTSMDDPTQDYWYWANGGWGYDGRHAAKAVTVAFGTAIACTPDGKSFIASGADEILPKWA